MSKLKNAVPERYTARFITPGVADYSAEGIGRVLVQKPALDKMMSTFAGKPVVNLQHTDKEPEELFQSLKNGADPKEFADGMVSSVSYDPESGWYNAEMWIWDEDTKKNIKDGYSVSCAYDVTELDDEGGTYNNVDYAEEVLDGEYVHMAIVPNPRYEKAYIIKNSKGDKMAVKLFKRKNADAPPEPEKKKPEEEEVDMENMDGVVVDEEGNEYPIDELVNAYRENKSKKNAMTKYNMDDEVEIDGEKMTVKELMAACGYGPKNENAESPLDENAEEVVDESKQMQNSAKKEKPNENFKKVKNAAGKTETVKRKLNTSSERLERGKQRYGNPVKQEAK